MTERYLNGPMVDRIRRCAADTSPNWDGHIRLYPPESRGLINLIDEVARLTDCISKLDPSEREAVLRPSGCGWCGRDHLVELPTLFTRPNQDQS